VSVPNFVDYRSTYLFVLFICRKEKDPLKPKHPLSAFFLFSNERRAALLAENKNVLEVAKIAGEEWKNMTEKQKRPYEEVYTAHNMLFLVGSLFTWYGFLDAFGNCRLQRRTRKSTRKKWRLTSRTRMKKL
jgi:hypothetical protein